MAVPSEALGAKDGGEGGIRTPGRFKPTPAFQASAFDHSATSPGAFQSSNRGDRSEERSDKGDCESAVKRKLNSPFLLFSTRRPCILGSQRSLLDRRAPILHHI